MLGRDSEFVDHVANKQVVKMVGVPAMCTRRHEVDLAVEELGPKMGCFTTVGMIGLEMRGLLGVVGA